MRRINNVPKPQRFFIVRLLVAARPLAVTGKMRVFTLQLFFGFQM